MLSMLVFWDRDGKVVATLDIVVVRDEQDNPVGLVDFEAHELAGGRMRDIADASKLDESLPAEVVRTVLGRDPTPDDRVTLPPDHPFRVQHETIAGCATWPEWLGGQAHDFKVELEPEPGQARTRLRALVHGKSGHRRERAVIEVAVAERIAEKQAEARMRGLEARAEARAMGMKKSQADAIPDPEPEPADVRDLLGGPDKPLLLDAEGRTAPKVERAAVSLPVVAARERG